jgi:hypothetical protein
MPLKLKAAEESIVKEPNENIKIGSTRAGLNFFPSIEKGGAKSTNGTKKIDNRRLYSFGLKFRSNDSISLKCLPVGSRISHTLAHSISFCISQISLVQSIE